MKLYLISQDVNNGYDTWNAFVVCAKNEEDAKTVRELDPVDEFYGGWVKDTNDIKVEYLGNAKPGSKRGIILESFNAG